MRDLDPVEHERLFFQRLQELVPDLDDWYHSDDDGSPWICVSYDFVKDNAVQATLRVDFDGSSLRGGWSPAFLNWDDGVRAEDARIDVHGPDGLAVDQVENPEQAADLAGAWFRAHLERREALTPRWRRRRLGRAPQ